jgi:hypothetical protein
MLIETARPCRLQRMEIWFELYSTTIDAARDDEDKTLEIIAEAYPGRMNWHVLHLFSFLIT